MAVEVLMPVITEAGEDGVVTAWMVDEGARVTAGTLIAEVQAEKVSQDVEAPVDGTVVGLVPINHPVPQGDPICRIVEAGEVAPPAPEPEPATEAPAVTAAARVVASPAAKRVARELGVDLAAVPGSGPEGRITEADVRHAATPAAVAESLSGLRAVVARNMRESAARTAAVTLTTQADLTAAPDQPLTAAVIWCAARALVDHPRLNGTSSGDGFFPGDGAQVAVAIETDEGLVAPVVRDAHTKSVAEIAEEVQGLAERARTRALTTADFENATFSVTNLGAFGIDAFTPIVNPPQIAILGVGALRTTPGIDAGGVIGARRMMTLSLTFDHAFVDGAPAAAFLAQVRGLLEAAER